MDILPAVPGKLPGGIRKRADLPCKGMPPRHHRGAPIFSRASRLVPGTDGRDRGGFGLRLRRFLRRQTPTAVRRKGIRRIHPKSAFRIHDFTLCFPPGPHLLEKSGGAFHQRPDHAGQRRRLFFHRRHRSRGDAVGAFLPPPPSVERSARTVPELSGTVPFPPDRSSRIVVFHHLLRGHEDQRHETG